MADKSTLRYAVDKLKAGQKVLDAFPELLNYPAFKEYAAGEGDALARFVILYADKGSEYRDLPLDYKKKKCLDAAGIQWADPRRASILAWQHEGVLKMVNEYIRLQSSLKYALWFHGCEAAWQTVEKLSAPIEANEKMDEAKLQTAYKTRKDNLDAMMQQVPMLETLGNQLFLDDEQLKEVQQRALLSQTGSVEKWAQGQTLVPKQK